MKTVRTVIQTILVIAFIISIGASIVVIDGQKTSGYSSTTKCSPAAREWIIEQFGDAKDIYELLNNINSFVSSRTYIPRQPSDIVQYFSIDKFIFEDNCDGLCFDFACFTATCTREISEYRKWEGITAIIVDAKSTQVENSYHSFNFIHINEDVVYIDTTFDMEKSDKVGAVNIGNYSMEEFSALLGWEIFAYH